jgi:hypothetical protein
MARPSVRRPSVTSYEQPSRGPSALPERAHPSEGLGRSAWLTIGWVADAIVDGDVLDEERVDAF